MCRARHVVPLALMVVTAGVAAIATEAAAGHASCLRLERSVRKLIEGEFPGGWRVEGAVLEECSESKVRMRIVAGRQVDEQGRKFELVVTSMMEFATARAAGRFGRTIAKELESLRARTLGLISNPAVGNFIDRYRPGAIRVESSPGSFLVKTEVLWQGIDRKVKLVLDGRRRDPVQYYEVPGVDAFCGRRELLRLAEAISDELAGCRAVWVEGRKEPVTAESETAVCRPGDEDCIPDAWRLRAVLEGQGCPPVVSLKVGKFLAKGVLERHDSWEEAE